MNRSGKLKAINDDAIYHLLNNKLYYVDRDGSIWTRLTVAGNLSVDGSFRRCDRTSYSLYREVSYTHNGRGYKLQAHRIVYARWVGNLEPDLMIAFADNDKHNTHPDNLRKRSQGLNMLHKFRDGHRKAVIGNSRFKPEEIKTIREFASKGVSTSLLAETFKTSKGHISDIVNRKIWKLI